VSTLQKLATALGVAINSFFVERDDGKKLIITRQGERTRSGSASVVLESLGYGLEGQACDPFIVTLKPGANSGRQAMIHAGTELILCLEGELDLEIAGVHHRLSPGDTALFRAEQTHRWRNPNHRPAVFLMMMQASDEREASMEQHLHP
jgi:quercetin dioxygenase-like cupin family protein